MSKNFYDRNRAQRARTKEAPHPARSSAARHPLPASGEREKRSARQDAAIAYNFDPQSETLDADYTAFHKGAKHLPEAQRKETRAKFEAALAARRAAQRRKLNDHFTFWFVCRDKACKRVSRCAGDPFACFDYWWPVTPEKLKLQFRAFMKACNAGLSNENAIREANDVVARSAEHIARVDAETLLVWQAREAAQAERVLTAEAPHPAPPDQVGGRHPLPASGEREERSVPRVRRL